MENKPVIITPADSCFTYALKRIGAEDLLAENHDDMEAFLDKFFDKNSWLKNAVPVKEGDILYWPASKPMCVPIEIDGEGRVIFHHQLRGRHFSVVEKNNYHSDITRKMIPVINTIRVRKIGEFSLGNPSFILRRK